MTVLVSLLVLAVLEIWTAVLVAQWIGAFTTALVLMGLSLLGVVLVRSEGLTAWRRVNAELLAGQVPGESLLDGLMIAAGGALLIVPGFVTAVPGLALLLPPVRRVLRTPLHRWVRRRADRSATFGGFSFGMSPGGPSTSGAAFPGGVRADRARGRWRGPIVDVTGSDADDRMPGAPAHAEVIDVEVDRRDEIGRAD